MCFFDTCNAVAAREDRKPKYWRLDITPSWIEFDVVTSQRQTQSASDCVMLLESITWDPQTFLQEINKRRNMEINNRKPYSRCRVWRCDVTTSNSIQDGGALVVNILVFDLRVKLQHCTYQRKTLLFALINVGTFICKREISGPEISEILIFRVPLWLSYFYSISFTSNIASTCV